MNTQGLPRHKVELHCLCNVADDVEQEQRSYRKQKKYYGFTVVVAGERALILEFYYGGLVTVLVQSCLNIILFTCVVNAAMSSGKREPGRKGSRGGGSQREHLTARKKPPVDATVFIARLG
ncbi:hypothetical protein Tsp_07150 [Trichinella spiralis]|uniref:hypothetical protein n=1 Tax=Trichinella spiralis TaxID=6334 RepID=UPI0001EFBD4F|nr:hypothetical protein Tsp_07150 [Trichinella spiralis]